MGPFAMVPVWLLDCCQDSSAIHLYALLGKYANRERRAWPKSDQLALAMGTSLRSVERTIATLRKLGALKTERRRRGDGAVLGLDFLLVQIDPSDEQEQPATGDGLSDVTQPATSGGMEASTQPATVGGMDTPAQPATTGGLSAPLPATGVAAIPPPVAVLYKEELDPVQPDPKDLAPAAPTPDGPAAPGLLDVYQNRFVERFHSKPNITAGKDAKLLALLATTHSDARVREMLEWFFRTTDAFIASTGYTVGVFYACFNKLQITHRPAVDVALADKHAELLEDIRRRGQERQTQREQDARAGIIELTAAAREKLKAVVIAEFDLAPFAARMRPDDYARTVKQAMVQYVAGHLVQRGQTVAEALTQFAQEVAA